MPWLLRSALVLHTISKPCFDKRIFQVRDHAAQDALGKVADVKDDVGRADHTSKSPLTSPAKKIIFDNGEVTVAEPLGQSLMGTSYLAPCAILKARVSLQQTGNESHRPWRLGRHTAPCERQQMNEVQLLSGIASVRPSLRWYALTVNQSQSRKTGHLPTLAVHTIPHWKYQKTRPRQEYEPGMQCFT